MFFFGILDDTGQIGVNKSFQAIVVREPAAQKGPLKMPPVPSSSQYAKAYDDQVLGHRRCVRTVALAGAAGLTRGEHGPTELGETDGC